MACVYLVRKSYIFSHTVCVCGCVAPSNHYRLQVVKFPPLTQYLPKLPLTSRLSPVREGPQRLTLQTVKSHRACLVFLSSRGWGGGGNANNRKKGSKGGNEMTLPPPVPSDDDNADAASSCERVKKKRGGGPTYLDVFTVECTDRRKDTDGVPAPPSSSSSLSSLFLIPIKDLVCGVPQSWSSNRTWCLDHDSRKDDCKKGQMKLTWPDEAGEETERNNKDCWLLSER